ncbi:MAG: hypothetical protein QOI03_44 [Solirubrobacteraceae bacterium]|jgi:anti-sigma B factor antagonist|nr:hypothetical protein [Solirubrobacteraceae bacterium]
MQPAPFEVSSDKQGEDGKLALSGELDIASAPRLEEAADAMLAQPVRRLVIDLSGLTFIDSSGLRLLIALNDRANEDGWTLALLPPPEPSRSVFQITGADENLPFIDPSEQ